MIYDLDIRMAFGKGEVLLKLSTPREDNRHRQKGYIQVEWLLSLEPVSDELMQKNLNVNIYL